MVEDGFTIEWPVWGVALVDRAVGLDGAMQIHDTFLYQPTWAQWAAMELTAVVDEYCARWVAEERLGNETAQLPPPCLLRLSRMTSSGEPDPPFEHQQEIAGQVVAAMRLYGGGDFIDPAEVGTYTSHPSGATSREVHTFRCAPYRWSPDTPYLVSSDNVDDLANLMAGVHHIDRDPSCTTAALAIENFLLSFGLAISGAERGLHRFIALEAMFGPLGQTVDGASFATRAGHGAQGHVPGARAWLEGAAELRNSLAHRLHDTHPDDEDLQMLEEITRGALVAFIGHLPDAGDDAVRSFNELLAAGPIEAGG